MQRFHIEQVTFIAITSIIIGIFGGLSCSKKSVSLNCSIKPGPERVLIISENAFDIFLQPKILDRAKGGEVFSREAGPDTIYVYRTNITVGSRLTEVGKAGRAFQYNEEGKFKDICAIDLNYTNEEIAEGLGIKKGVALHVIGRIQGGDRIDLLNMTMKLQEALNNPGATVQFKHSNGNDIKITMEGNPKW